MKKFIAILAVGTCLMSPLAVAAQTAAPATSLGVDLAQTVAKALFGKGVEYVFGKDGITKKELNEALDAHFEKYEMSVLNSKVIALKDAAGTFNYDPQADLLLVQGDLNNIFDYIHQIYGDIETHINAGNFKVTLPDYVFMTNMRLAFLGHKHNLDPKGGWDRVAAQAAADALGKLFYYYDAKFVDTTPRKCVTKNPSGKFFTVRGQDIDYKIGWGEFLTVNGWTTNATFPHQANNLVDKAGIQQQEKKFGARFPSKMLCARRPDSFGFTPADVQQASGINVIWIDANKLPHGSIFMSKHVFKHPHHSSYYFTNPEKDGTYSLQGPFSHMESAREIRVMLAIRKYQDDLGNVRDAALEWYKIAAESGDETAKSTAKHNASKLGLISRSGHIIEK